jgi:glycosyltransferase involved in cell wall biosynthesis
MKKQQYRICLFLPSLCGGGAERVMVNLASGFADQDIKVDLVLAKAEGPYILQVPTNVRVIDLKASRVIASLPGLVRYLRQEHPKALLSALDHTNVVAILAKKLARVPTRIIVSVHSNPSKATANALSLRDKLMPYWTRAFYPQADVVVAVSNGVAEDLIRVTGLPKEKIKVIYNSVITPELFDKANEHLNHPWFAPNEPPVILGTGRLTIAKDFPTLIRAFALVRKQYPVRLMILGEGEERPKLEELIRKLGIQKDVALPGFVENPYKYMKRAAMFVLSSQWEGLPTVLIEALAVGIPVVSTDCESGPREILKNGRFGKLVSVGDEIGLAKALISSLKGPNLPPCDAWYSFSLKTTLKEYMQILKEG